ncbi:MAG: N-acetylmuramidase domain-containing protein [Neomegalonema sp.]
MALDVVSKSLAAVAQVDARLPGERFRGSLKRLTERDWDDAVERLGCEREALEAFVETEVGRKLSGFGRFGRVKALFMAHIFHTHTGGQFDRSHPHLSVPRWTPELYGVPPHGVFEQIDEAMALDQEAAIKATSWGLLQIHPSQDHLHAMGLRAPIEMVDAFRKGEREQLMGAVDLLKAKGLDSALRSHDWARLARVWNGPGYRKHNYDGRMARSYERRIGGAYRERSGRSSFIVLSINSEGPAVQELQELLGRAGYSVTVDGFFGTRTQQAVKAFQGASKLAVDGVVGRMTWDALKATPTGPIINKPTIEEATPWWAKFGAFIAAVVEPLARIFDGTVLGLFPPWALGGALLLAMVIGAACLVKEGVFD